MSTTIPLNPNNTPGMTSGSYSIVAGTIPTVTSESAGYYCVKPLPTHYIIGGKSSDINISNDVTNSVVLSATDRSYESGDISKSIYLRSDRGVFVEDPDQPDHFINLIEELSQTRQELKELKEIVNKLYYAPGAPGYIQAEASFNNVVSKGESD